MARVEVDRRRLSRSLSHRLGANRFCRRRGNAGYDREASGRDRLRLPTRRGASRRRLRRILRSESVLSRWMELHYVSLATALEYVENRAAARVHIVRGDGKLDEDEPDTDLAAAGERSGARAFVGARSRECRSPSSITPTRCWNGLRVSRRRRQLAGLPWRRGGAAGRSSPAALPGDRPLGTIRLRPPAVRRVTHCSAQTAARGIGRRRPMQPVSVNRSQHSTARPFERPDEEITALRQARETVTASCPHRRRRHGGRLRRRAERLGRDRS